MAEKNKLVCICGMCGAGKSVVADEFVKAGYQFIRFGQITLDICKKQGDASEANQKKIREGLRVEHGMAAFAKLNIPKFDEALTKGHVIGDGLYSWSEYKVLKEKYGDKFKIIAIWAPPETRYDRISERKPDANDKDLRKHQFTREEAISRDYAEIGNIEKGGPIAMADYLLTNTGTIDELIAKTQKIIQELTAVT